MTQRNDNKDEELFASIAKENNWHIPQSNTLGQRFLMGESVSSATAPMGSQLPMETPNMQNLFMPSFGNMRVNPNVQHMPNTDYYDSNPTTAIRNHQEYRKNMASKGLDPNIQAIPKELLFSASGFDIVSALVKMATRPNPKIQLGNEI